MKIELFNQNSESFPWALVFLWGALWLFVLYCILTRRDFDSSTKLLWVVVVIFVPFFGVLLYWFAAPGAPLEYPLSKSETVIPGSDVSGTPWADNPNHTKES